LTFQDLQKLVQSEAGQTNNINLQAKLQGKGFWYWHPSKHKQIDKIDNGNCCFNLIIGLPRKEGMEKPLFDYELILYKALMQQGYLNSYPYQRDQQQNDTTYTFKEKHVWIKKATGLGITEFFLRFMAWLCLRNDYYKDSQMCIITGPNQELAIKLIKRMKALFEPHWH
jgi:hypothetical protein